MKIKTITSRLIMSIQVHKNSSMLKSRPISLIDNITKNVKAKVIMFHQALTNMNRNLIMLRTESITIKNTIKERLDNTQMIMCHWELINNQWKIRSVMELDTMVERNNSLTKCLLVLTNNMKHQSSATTNSIMDTNLTHKMKRMKIMSIQEVKNTSSKKRVHKENTKDKGITIKKKRLKLIIQPQDLKHYLAIIIKKRQVNMIPTSRIGREEKKVSNIKFITINRTFTKEILRKQNQQEKLSPQLSTLETLQEEDPQSR